MGIKHGLHGNRGVERGQRTRDTAESLCGYLRDNYGLKFGEVFICPDPTDPRRKSTVLAQLGAHALVDDRDYITTECARTGAKTFLAYPSAQLTWFPQILAWVRQGGVDRILERHWAVALRLNQYTQPRLSTKGRCSDKSCLTTRGIVRKQSQKAILC